MDYIMHAMLAYLQHSDSFICASCRLNDALVEELSHPAAGSQPLHFDRPYAASSWQQFLVLSKRWQRSYW
jgi:hypothetical protein